MIPSVLAAVTQSSHAFLDKNKPRCESCTRALCTRGSTGRWNRLRKNKLTGLPPALQAGAAVGEPGLAFAGRASRTANGPAIATAVNGVLGAG